MTSKGRWTALGLLGSLLLAGAGSLALANAVLANPVENAPGRFVRGDANNDGIRDISDAVFILSFLFSGGSRPLCDEASDINGDGTRDISDPVYLLSYLFLGKTPPPQPFPECGLDPGGALCPVSSCNL